MTDGDERRKLILDQKTKKKISIKAISGREKKTRVKRSQKKTLGQPVNTTGRKTLGTGAAASGGDHRDRPSRGGAMWKLWRRLGFWTGWTDTMLEERERDCCEIRWMYY